MRGALRRELGLAPDVPLVGIVGRLSPIKNHYLFLEVAARIAAVRPDVRFLVVGDGELGSAIRARAHRLKLSNRVIFAGWRSDLAQVYGDLDVLQQQYVTGLSLGTRGRSQAQNQQQQTKPPGSNG